MCDLGDQFSPLLKKKVGVVCYIPILLSKAPHWLAYSLSLFTSFCTSSYVQLCSWVFSLQRTEELILSVPREAVKKSFIKMSSKNC